jgi:hypothetical protein
MRSKRCYLTLGFLVDSGAIEVDLEPSCAMMMFYADLVE